MNSLICTPITETEAAPFLAAMTEAEAVADAIELRLDYLTTDALPVVLHHLRERITRIGKPLVLTFRPREQGGQRDVSLADRQEFWRNLPPEIVTGLGFADFELDLVESFAQAPPPVPWAKVICSWHNFAETPATLTAQFERMARTPAAVVKIATMANRIGDCLPLLDLIERRADRPVIILGMGLPGLLTRVLSVSRGALLTFGALRRGAESAAGQPTVVELRDLYRATALSRASMILGIIGNPVGHSRSPRMHNAALHAVGKEGVYLPFEVLDAAAFIRDFVRPATRQLDWQLRGLSVTIPHKLAVIPQLDFVDETARVIGAVNTLVVEGDQLHGYNTDCQGAMNPLDALLDVRGARVAVIGAGGSARAICHGLRQRGADVTIYARNLDKAQPLADEFQTKLAALEQFAGQTDVVINCTPIGMHGHSEGQTPLSADKLHGIKLVYDLIYTPQETALLRAARAAGCQTLGGLAMLVGQAGEQFRLWTGSEAPLDVMWQAVE